MMNKSQMPNGCAHAASQGDGYVHCHLFVLIEIVLDVALFKIGTKFQFIACYMRIHI